MKKLLLLLLIIIILFTACNSGMTPANPETPNVDNSLKEGIIIDIQIETITEDSSNDRAVTGAVLGGHYHMFKNWCDKNI